VRFGLGLGALGTRAHRRIGERFRAVHECAGPLKIAIISGDSDKLVRDAREPRSAWRAAGAGE